MPSLGECRAGEHISNLISEATSRRWRRLCPQHCVSGDPHMVCLELLGAPKDERGQSDWGPQSCQLLGIAKLTSALNFLKLGVSDFNSHLSFRKIHLLKSLVVYARVILVPQSTYTSGPLSRRAFQYTPFEPIILFPIICH